MATAIMAYRVMLIVQGGQMIKMLRLVLPALVLTGSAAHAQPVQTIDIAMTDFKFEPAHIVLQHGQAYVLRFENKAEATHEFTAKAFLKAVTIAPESKAFARHGEVELKGGKSADVHITAPPTPGTYEIHCGKPGHAEMGMKGDIVVQ